MHSININDECNVYVWDSERRSSLSNHFVSSQVDNLFYLESHGPHTRSTVLARSATQTTEREHECAITIRQTTPGRGSVSPSGHHRSDIACIELHGLISNCLAVALSKQLSAGSSSSGVAHVRWNTAVPMVAGRYYRAKIPGWMLRGCTT